jgi:hypothetical protein
MDHDSLAVIRTAPSSRDDWPLNLHNESGCRELLQIADDLDAGADKIKKRPVATRIEGRTDFPLGRVRRHIPKRMYRFGGSATPQRNLESLLKKYNAKLPTSGVCTSTHSGRIINWTVTSDEYQGCDTF